MYVVYWVHGVGVQFALVGKGCRQVVGKWWARGVGKGCVQNC